MSSILWQYFLQDDVESFGEFLANAIFSNTHRSGGIVAATAATPKLGSPGGNALALSPNVNSRSRRYQGASQVSSYQEKAPILPPSHPATLTRADINAKDRYGRTLLHLAASSQKASAFEFASALLGIPILDIYAQDLESGWTALHRALYAGNASIAQAIISRDIKDAISFNSSGTAHHSFGGLIRIKDREGLSPFEVFGSTIAAESLNGNPEALHRPDNDTASTVSSEEAEPQEFEPKKSAGQYINFEGDEIFTFGSNKNVSLGQGDQDDRQYPERVTLTRPDHLLFRFHRVREAERLCSKGQEIHEQSELPTLIRFKPIIIQDVVMSKLHTGIITNDPESNLFMCGFGPGGRLGTGDEVTRYNFVCIESGGIAGKKIVSVALGLDHSIAISDQGEVFSWGSNKYGQLGYGLPKSSRSNDIPIQTIPRQIYNPFKREDIIGAAASSIHSVVFTSSAIYTFGKNEGQLGLTDADARSLETQTIPRKVGASLFNSPILMVSAIDRATTCLLENHDVWVFTHYGYSKLVFPLDGSSSFIRDSFMATRYGFSDNFISKITSGGNTICAMSSYGEVYTINVNQKADTRSTASSTTNPAKIRNALPQPSRVWSIKKSHMAVRDVDVGQDGTIIISTESGSAWLKEKRAKIKDVGRSSIGDRNAKDYKFVRAPGLSRAVAVRSNAFGAYAVIQRACDVTKKQIAVESCSLWDDLWPLMPGNDMLRRNRAQNIEIISRTRTIEPDDDEEKGVTAPSDLESNFDSTIQLHNASFEAPTFVWLSSSSSEVRIPVHEFILAARSSVLRRALADFRQSYYFAIPDVLSIEYDKAGQVHIQIQDVNFLSIFNLVLFLYTDKLYDVWTRYRHDGQKIAFYRQIRVEVMKLAVQLDLRTLEHAARIMIQPTMNLSLEMEIAIQDSDFFANADVIIELDGSETKAHSHLLCQRCPFFDGLFHGRAGGRWISSRLQGKETTIDPVRIDLKHIDPSVFQFVLRHIYADTEDELFDDVKTADLDEFIDLVIDVMSVANELMLDRLCQVCQKLLGTFVNTRNVCHLLNAVAPCSVSGFKQAALEFICLNLEVMLQNRLLDDLDPDLLPELDIVCHHNQYSSQPVSRGRNTDEFIANAYPEAVPLIEADKQRLVDAMRLTSHLHEDEMREGSFKAGSLEKNIPKSPLARKGKQVALSTGEKDISQSPTLKAKQSVGDLIFYMDDESSLSDNIMPANSDYLDTPATPAPSRSLATTPNDPLQIQDLPGDKTAYSKWDTSTSVSKIPWGSITPSKSSVGLKDIMAEASSPRPSNAHLESPRHDLDHIRNLTPKLSQKERRKLKQQQISDKLSEQQPASPWQVVDSKPKPLSFDDPDVSQTNPNNLATPPRPTPKSSLNLRQTIAGTPPPPLSNLTPNTPPPSKSADPSSQYKSSVSATPNIIVPERTPSASTSSAQVSLASILHQQQSEKDVIQEAATAKHNLHDIQVEQEFQAWWDMESKRVKDEAEAEARTKPKDDRGRRTRGSSRGGGRRGGGGSSGRRRGNPSAPQDVDPNSPAKQSSQSPGSTPARAPVVAGDSSNNQGTQPGRSGDDKRRQHGRGRGRGGERGGKTPQNPPSRAHAS